MLGALGDVRTTLFFGGRVAIQLDAPNMWHLAVHAFVYV